MTQLVIQAPRQGISQSPHVGFADVRNLDIFSIPGVVRLNTEPVKESGTVIVDNINWVVRHPVTTTEIYALGATGEVYKSTDSGDSWAVLAGHENTAANGNGLAIWKNYLFVARDTKLDVCGDGSATGITAANWTLDWTTSALTSDVLWHPMLVSKNDNKLYIGAANNILSLDEVVGKTFAPGDNSTYTFSDAASVALDLPSGYRIKCLEELGNNLMIGTWKGTSLASIDRVADIFPWDRSSTTFGQPIVVDDFGVHAMKNIGNILYVLAGITGTIRRTDGVNSYVVGQIPTDLSGGKYIEFYPGSACHYKNRFFFGTGNGGTTAVGGQGVYSLQLTGKGNILTLEHYGSTLNDGSATSAKYTALQPITQDTLLIAWRSGDS